MTPRRIILISVVAALAVANLASLAPSRSDQAGTAEKVPPHPPNKPFRNPFPGATQVRLFVETNYVGKGEPTYSKPKGRVLTASQRAEFESLIEVYTIAPDDLFTACFIPHHFFRYFDKAGKLVGEVEVCFCCGGVHQSNGSNVRLTEAQMLVADFGKLKSFVAALGERTDVQCEAP